MIRNQELDRSKKAAAKLMEGVTLDKEKAKIAGQLVARHGILNRLTILNAETRGRFIPSDREYVALVKGLADNAGELELSAQGLSDLNELLRERYARYPRGSSDYIRSILVQISPDSQQKDIALLRTYGKYFSHFSLPIIQKT